MTILLCITIAEFIRETLDEGGIHSDSLIISRVRAEYFRRFFVVSMFHSIFDCIGLYCQPFLVIGVVDWAHYIEAVAVFVFSLYFLLIYQ